MSVVDDIKGRLDIIDVVSGYVALKKAGSNYKALCPFHTEKTPSFVVNPDRQSWRCFGACSMGGDAFSFVMRQERLDFGEALKLLAERTGVVLEQRRDVGRDEALRRVNQETAKFYQQTLVSAQGLHAMEYLSKREVNEQARLDFQLGFSPKGRDGLKTHLLGLGFDLEHGIGAGVLHRDQAGSVRDFFWGRLMYPIHDREGRVIGFGGRSLDGSNPKYINTAATTIFDKRATVYGLHMAASSIRDDDTVIIVEGYMDVIAARQHGYANVVASMGTALTEQQVSRLKSQATRFILALDPDVAGQEATLRSLESAWHELDRTPLGRRESVDLRVAALPPGRDPDELIRHNHEEWEGLISDAAPFMEFLIPAIASRYDLTTGRGKAAAADVVLPLIISTVDAIDQERHFRMLAHTLSVTQDALKASIGSLRPRRRSRTGGGNSHSEHRGAGVSPFMADTRDQLEEYVLALLWQMPELNELVEAVKPEQFLRTENQKVFTCWQRCSTIDELREGLDKELTDQLDRILSKPLPPANSSAHKKSLEECVQRLKERQLRERKSEEELRLSQANLEDLSLEEVEILKLNKSILQLFTNKE